MLVAVRIDADRRHQGHILVHVNAVDLDHQQIEAGKIGRHPFLQPRRRQRDKMPGSRRSRQACPLWRRHVALGQAHRPSEPARRDVDQHLVHRPFAEPVFALRGLPTGKSLLLAVEAAKPGTRHLDLAAVETDLALRLAPAMRLAPTTPFMALAAGRQRVLLHHLGERLEPCRKAEPLEARRHARQRLGFNRIRGNRGRCAKFLHGVASFRGISTPSLTAQGEQRRSSIFNNDRDIPREKAKTATDPMQWHQIADAWDQLARHVESLRSPEWRKTGPSACAATVFRRGKVTLDQIPARGSTLAQARSPSSSTPR